MKIAIICFSFTGLSTGERIVEGLCALGHEVKLYKKSKYLEDSVKESIGVWTKMQFPANDALLFIGASGIAVRAIAPMVASKKTDPAVLVIDECGMHVISLLSGHLGGANELAIRVSELLGATPVITTATDLHHQFAVDVFSKKNGCAIFNMKAAKEVSAAILAKEPVGFYSEFPFSGALPDGCVRCDEHGYPLSGDSLNGKREALRLGVCVTIYKDKKPFTDTVQIVPRVVALGMGCRKNKESEAVRKAAEGILTQCGIFSEAVMSLASIEIKKDEPGLYAVSNMLNVPFLTYSAEELLQAEGVFTASAFVKGVTGVDSVCERSAVVASGQGRLIQRKTAGNGVTAALAIKDWRICFE